MSLIKHKPFGLLNHLQNQLDVFSLATILTLLRCQ